jgi:tRNA(Ile)-lysidine synthase
VQLTSPAGEDWVRTTGERLSARLKTKADQPVALALSGGGDSIALLHIAAAWAAEAGRRLLALTVDHQLNPDSGRWTRFAQAAAQDLGADWRGLDWTGDKPATGLAAAARAARHRLIAEAARDAGARVVLFAHTADDIAEADRMRDEGSTLGHLRDWSPSPAWPEGRGLMLLRPMLDSRRGDIREWLRQEGLEWVDDPANDDLRLTRSRARVELAQEETTLSETSATVPEALTETVTHQNDGVIRLDRSTSAATLAAALVCAGGGDRLPRGPRLARALERLQAGEAFSATLCGARLEADDDAVLIMREPGELRRLPSPPLRLTPGQEAVWDGRWAVTVAEPGWSVVASAGRQSRLPPADRARLKALPASARGARPVLIRDTESAAVLAGTIGAARSLVEQRLALRLGAVTQERHLD